MPEPVLFGCVGGFLGAGKTTALAAAARELAARGRRVGLVANDQGQDLVDTAVFRGLGLPAAEVAGGCFCCRFDDLLAEADRLLADRRVDVLLAEAVGSCTDLVATVYRPLRRLHPGRFRLSPLSVLVEPSRLEEMAGAGVPQDVSYIFGRQLAEADLVVLSKVDRLPRDERVATQRSLKRLAGDASILELSAASGEGVSAWVDRLLGGEGLSDRELDVDYDAYARGEAALAWLNASVEVQAPQPVEPRAVGEALVGEIRQRSRRARLLLPHVKTLVAAGGRSARIALTRTEGEARWEGDAELPAATGFEAIVNARAVAQPEAFRTLVEDAVAAAAKGLGASLAIMRLECFSPARPVPRYRFSGPAGS